MTNRIKIKEVRYNPPLNNGYEATVTAVTVGDCIYVQYGVCQDRANAVAAHGSINPQKWDLILDPVAEKHIARLEAEEIDEWDEEAQYQTAYEDAEQPHVR